jgi:hypothetical protein
MRKGQLVIVCIATTLSLDCDAGSLPRKENIAIIILQMGCPSPADQSYCVIPFMLLQRVSEIFSLGNPLGQSHGNIEAYSVQSATVQVRPDD